jgi:hypothetical protein
MTYLRIVTLLYVLFYRVSERKTGFHFCWTCSKDAMMPGFRTIVASDACAVADQAQHESALLSFDRNFGDVMIRAAADFNGC